MMSTTLQIAKTIYSKLSSRESSFKVINSNKLDKLLLVFGREN